jgi:tetratricopeptide (TPR) repeat protein
MAGINWQEILGWSSEQIEDLRFIAYSYVKQGLYDVALTVFHAIDSLSKTTPYDVQTVGAIYLQQGDCVKAIQFLDRAVEMEPEHLPTRLNRAKAQLMLGYIEEGLQEAASLTSCTDPQIANHAAALLLAYKK